MFVIIRKSDGGILCDMLGENHARTVFVWGNSMSVAMLLKNRKEAAKIARQLKRDGTHCEVKSVSKFSYVG